MKKPYVSPFPAPGVNKKTAELRAFFDRVRAIRPSVWFCPALDPFPEDPRIAAIRFSGLPYQGRENTVFAYIGFPDHAAPSSPVPGMVLVHGGGGHAYAEWVRYWADRGYAAISFDGYGQIYTGAEHTYDASLDFWKPDPALHLPNDGFSTVGKPLEDQGFTYYVSDVLLAHSLLRADPRVDETKIGLTGISWGGIAASAAVCLDGRFAFAAPVYGSGFLNESNTAWGEYFRHKDVSDAWDAKHMLPDVNVPVRFFNSDRDPFFDANAATASAAAAPLGSLTLLPGFTHGQNEGAAIPELARFADEQTGRGRRNITIDAIRACGGGAEIRFTLPGDVKTAEVCMYRKTEGLIYEDKYLREAWIRETGETANGSAVIRIPAEARLFYFCVEGKTDGAPAQTLHTTTGVYSRETWAAAQM